MARRPSSRDASEAPAEADAPESQSTARNVLLSRAVSSSTQDYGEGEEYTDEGFADEGGEESDFFLPDASQQRGIHCRFGMPGIIAEAHYDGIKAFSETDFTEDLKKFDVPTLILHGDDDQIVPIGSSALLSAKLVPDAILKIYPGGSHSLGDTSREQFNQDLLAFARS